MFNKETEYALRALVYIMVQNGKGLRPGITEIARETDAPGFFIAKILQKLVRHGMVTSLKGRNGGFYFSDDNTNHSLKELIMLTEGNKVITGCGFGLKNCSESNPCPLHEQYAPIRDAIAKLVSTETIQTLAHKYTNLKCSDH